MGGNAFWLKISEVWDVAQLLPGMLIQGNQSWSGWGAALGQAAGVQGPGAGSRGCALGRGGPGLRKQVCTEQHTGLSAQGGGAQPVAPRMLPGPEDTGRTWDFVHAGPG